MAYICAQNVPYNGITNKILTLHVLINWLESIPHYSHITIWCDMEVSIPILFSKFILHHVICMFYLLPHAHVFRSLVIFYLRIFITANRNKYTVLKCYNNVVFIPRIMFRANQILLLSIIQWNLCFITTLWFEWFWS